MHICERFLSMTTMQADGVERTRDHVVGEEQNDHYLLLQTSCNYICSSTGSLELADSRHGSPFAAAEFESRYRRPEESIPFANRIKRIFKRKWTKFSVRSTLFSNFPTLSNMRQYKVREYLPNDAVAGLTAGITMIPQGMAFASLSTLPPIVGLYISLFASLAYFFLGTSHQLSWGCVAVLSILTGNILDNYANKVKAEYSYTITDSDPSDAPTSTLLNVLEPNFTSDTLLNTTMTPAVISDVDSLQLALSVEKKIEVAGAVALISGIILAVLGKVGLGRVTSFMSDTLITSFTVGVSFHVVSSQIKSALGLNFPRQSGIFKLIRFWVVLLSNIHQANPATVMISLVCFVCLYIVKRFINERYKSKLRVPVPIELFVIIVATVVSRYADFSEKYSVNVVKEIPVGVPQPRVPDLSLGKDYVIDGLVIIIVSFTQNVAMAKLMGLKHNYRIDANQEMFACGMVSVVCSLFSGFISGPSVSRSLVQDGAGGKTQVASLFAAALVFLVVMLIGPYFYYLPTCVLAAIIIVNLRSMFLKMTTVPDLWRKSRVDGSVWIITCAATVILETDLGLLVGIIASILFVLIRSQMNTIDVLSEIVSKDNHVWRSEDRYIGGKTLPGWKIIRINSALYFANAEIITDQVFKKTRFNPIKVKENKVINVAQSGHVQQKDSDKPDSEMLLNYANALASKVADTTESNQKASPESTVMEANDLPFKCLLVDLALVPFIDMMGVQALELLVSKYQTAGISVYFSGAQEKCMDTLQKTGFLDKHSGLVFISIETAIKQVFSAQVL